MVKITLRMLLEHMQAGFESVKTELRSEFHAEFRRELDPLKKAVTQLQENVVQLQKNDEKTHLALQRLYDRRIETVERVDDHEERITVIEDVELPKVKAAVGIA